MKKIVKTAFTLIELLVVIAIIGILSGLIVVTMNGVTEKANIAKSQIFSNSLRNALMFNLVSEYKFDGNVNDSWGTNHGTLNGASYDNTVSDCVYEECISFGGTLAEYVQIPAITSLTTGTPLILSVWIYPQVETTYETIMGYDTLHRLLIQTSGTLLSQQDGDFYSSTGAISFNKWSYVLYWNDGTQEKWYVNGKQSGTTHSTINAEWNGAFMIGQYDLVHYPYKGRIDEIRIYNSTINLSQIEEQYYSGLNSLYAKGQVTEQEYQNGILGIK
jgi:prepilin-type N-terminal cleavage/methylation domain-containing protein